MVTVKISEKGGQKSNYEFDKSEVTIGRMKGNDIVLPKGNVSKKHARIYDRGGALTIDDLDSTNGTYVNGRRVTSEQDIDEGDTIYIGDFILQVQPERDNAPPDAPPKPPEQGNAQDQSGASRPPSPPQGQRGDADGTNPPNAPQSGRSQDQYGSSQSGARQPSRDSDPGPRSAGAGGLDDTGAGGSRNSTRRDSSVDSDGSHAGRGSGPRNRPSRSSSPGSERNQRGSRSDRAGRRTDERGGDEGTASGPASGQGGSGSGNERSADRSGSDIGPSPGRSGTQGRESSSPQRPPSGRDSGNNTGPNPERSPGGRDSGNSTDSSPAHSAGGRGGPNEHGSPPDAPPERQSSGGRASEPDDSPEPAAPAEPGAASSRRRPEERASDELAGERRRERSHVSLPSSSFQSEFDESFHEHQRAVAEQLFSSVDPAELPGSPPSDEERERWRDLVLDAIDYVVPPVDEDALLGVLLSECVGLGPLETYLDDETVRSIHVNAWDRVVLERDQGRVLAPRAFSHEAMLEAVAARCLGTDALPGGHAEASLEDGTHVQVVSSSIAVEGPALTLQKPVREVASLDDLVQDDVLSAAMKSCLERAVRGGQSILVGGGPGGGASRLLGALAREIPEGARIAAVEDHPQLDLHQDTVVRLQTSGTDGLDVVGAADAMQADRVLLDTADGSEARGWVRSAAGHTYGNLATIRAIDALDALEALESACLVEETELGPRGVRRRIARAVDLVVFISSAGEDRDRIRQISEVRGVELDTFHLEDIFYFDDDGVGGAFEATGYIPLFYEDLRHAGLDVDFDIFRD